MSENHHINAEWANAKQVYATFGIARSMLGRLADTGKIERRTIHGDYGVLNLYRVKDIERVIAGGDE